jgi:ribosomal protein S18 acetylase RimI-like enzyme
LVRLATLADLDHVARLMAGFRDWQGRTEPNDASIRATAERLLADPDADFLLGGDPPAGVCQLRYRLSIWTGVEDCCLEDLFVDDSARGSGLGRALLDAALERARERGCARVELDANEANGPALALYRSVGFDSRSKRADGHDLFMRLRL